MTLSLVRTARHSISITEISLLCSPILWSIAATVASSTVLIPSICFRTKLLCLLVTTLITHSSPIIVWHFVITAICLTLVFRFVYCMPQTSWALAARKLLTICSGIQSTSLTIHFYLWKISLLLLPAHTPTAVHLWADLSIGYLAAALT